MFIPLTSVSFSTILALFSFSINLLSVVIQFAINFASLSAIISFLDLSFEYFSDSDFKTGAAFRPISVSRLFFAYYRSFLKWTYTMAHPRENPFFLDQNMKL